MFPPGGGGPIMPNFGFPFGEGPFAGYPNPVMQQMVSLLLALWARCFFGVGVSAMWVL